MKIFRLVLWSLAFACVVAGLAQAQPAVIDFLAYQP